MQGKDWREKKKKKMETEKKGKKVQPSSLPSLCERSETPGALDRCVHWESQETPVSQSHLSALPITGVLAVGRGRRESILYAGAEPATRLLGRQHSEFQIPAHRYIVSMSQPASE